MNKRRLIIPLAIFTFLIMIVYANEFKLYPNAKVDEKATKEAMEVIAAAKMDGIKATIYTTSDSFQKVASFYKNIAKEYFVKEASGSSGKPTKSDLCDGCDLWEAFFIFDDAKDISSSKLWIKIQRPYIGDEVIDQTAIILTEKSK